MKSTPRLRTFDDLDRRTRAAQATIELRDRLIADLGGPDKITAAEMEIVDSLATTSAILTHRAVQILNAESGDVSEFVRLASMQRALIADLGPARRLPKAA